MSACMYIRPENTAERQWTISASDAEPVRFTWISHLPDWLCVAAVLPGALRRNMQGDASSHLWLCGTKSVAPSKRSVCLQPCKERQPVRGGGDLRTHVVDARQLSWAGAGSIPAPERLAAERKSLICIQCTRQCTWLSYEKPKGVVHGDMLKKKAFSTVSFERCKLPLQTGSYGLVAKQRQWPKYKRCRVDLAGSAHAVQDTSSSAKANAQRRVDSAGPCSNIHLRFARAHGQ
jgi:hypothetical protein